MGQVSNLPAVHADTSSVNSPVPPPAPQSVSIRFTGRPVTWLGLACIVLAVAPITGFAVAVLTWNATRLPWADCVMWGIGAGLVAAAAVILPIQMGVFRGEATRQYRRARRLLRSPQKLAALPDAEICELILRGRAIAPDRLSSLRYRHIARVERQIGRRLPRVWIDEAARRHAPEAPDERLESRSGQWSLYAMKDYPAGSIQVESQQMLPIDLAAVALGLAVAFQIPHGHIIALAGVIPFLLVRNWLYPQRWWLALSERDALLVYRRRGGRIEREIPLDLDESFVMATERRLEPSSGLLGAWRRYSHAEEQRFALWLVLRPDSPARMARALLPWDRGPWAGL